MPYSIIHSHPDCLKESGETGQYQVGGHAVVKDDDGSLMGCHKTHKSAQDQITALNIAEAERKVAQLVSEGILEPRKNYKGKNTKPKAKPKKSKGYRLQKEFDSVVAISQTIDTQKRNTILKEMEKLTENRSFTFSAVEERNDNDTNTLLFTGYASVFNKPYGVRDHKGVYDETIQPGAFKKTLKEQDDVRFLVNHDGIPLARTSSGTLELEEDQYGLFVRAELDPTNPTVAEVASAMKRGDLMKCHLRLQQCVMNLTNRATKELYRKQDCLTCQL